MTTATPYVYVASSWRNPSQPAVIEALRAAGIDCYDFRNPGPDNNGFSWRDVEPDGMSASERTPLPKGQDLVPVDRYLEMIDHPVARSGFHSDFDAMHKATAFVLVLPCGRSAHLELGWAAGAGKPTAILLEDPAEPELMYRMVNKLARHVDEIVTWLNGLTSPPATLADACREVLEDPERKPGGVTAGEVLEEIHRRHPGAFPLVSMLDVHDELVDLYGRAR